MKAAARIAVEHCDGRDHVVRRDAEAPFSVRRCGDRVLIAASAAAPVGGDELQLAIDVGPGARADVGSVAATVVWPSPRPAWSSTTTRCDVAAAADLRWWPEPTVSVAGSQHRSVSVVRLDATASCTLVEEVALGRTGERSGVLVLDLRVERAGRPLVHHVETFGCDASAVGSGSGRHVISAVVVGGDVGAPASLVDAGCAAAWLPQATDVAVALAVGPDRPAAWTALLRVAPSGVAGMFLQRLDHSMVRPSDQSAREVRRVRRS